MNLQVIVFFLAILLLGCSSEDMNEEKVNIEDSNLINPSTSEKSGYKLSESRGTIKEVEFEKDLHCCSDYEVTVGKMAAFTVDNQNRVFIADIDQVTVHVFSAEGNYLASLGRQGNGPGEYHALTPNTSMYIHPDRIYITDGFYQGRAHVYLLDDLSFSHTINLVADNKNDYAELKGYFPGRMYPLNEAKYLVAYQRSRFDYQDSESIIQYMIQDSTGTIVTGAILEQKDLVNSVYNPPNGGTRMTSFPFYGKSLLTVSDEDHLFAVHDSKEIKIDIYDTKGEHIRTFELPFGNKPLTRRGLIEHYQNHENLARLDQYEGENVALRMIREEQNLPEFWPALESIFNDDENRLWVSTIVEDFEIYEWWVLEETGELITRFEWPRDEPIEVVRNGYMYTRQTDEDTGLQQVVRYRIELNG